MCILRVCTCFINTTILTKFVQFIPISTRLRYFEYFFWKKRFKLFWQNSSKKKLKKLFFRNSSKNPIKIQNFWKSIFFNWILWNLEHQLHMTNCASRVTLWNNGLKRFQNNKWPSKNFWIQFKQAREHPCKSSHIVRSILSNWQRQACPYQAACPTSKPMWPKKATVATRGQAWCAAHATQLA